MYSAELVLPVCCCDSDFDTRSYVDVNDF